MGRHHSRATSISPKLNCHNESKKISYIRDSNDIKGFKLIPLNVRSLLPKVNLLRADLHDVSFHVLCINETWLKPNVSDNLIKLEGYNLIRVDRKVRNANGDLKPGGGIMIYYLIDYICLPIDNITMSNEDLEIMGIVLSKIDHPKTVIINIYRPPSGNVTCALQKLNEVCKSVTNMFKHSTIYITGDLNVNLLKQTPQSILFTELCAHFSLYKLVNTPTRVSENSEPSLLDIYVSNSTNICASGILEYNISDHLMIYCVAKMLRNDRGIDKQKTKVRSFKRYDLDLLEQSLVYYNWGRFYATTDVDDAWHMLYNQILANANYYAPLTDHYERVNQPEWFSATILEASIERDRLYKSANSFKDPMIYKKAKKKSFS